MGNTRPTKTESGSESKAVISDDSIKSELVAVTGSAAPSSSSPATTATMQNGSKKTWTSAELAELQSKAGLVAGALADFQAAGGRVVFRNIEFEPGQFAPKLYLVADGLNIQIAKTADGLDFEIQPLG